MPADVVTPHAAGLGRFTSADHFEFVLDVVCMEFALGSASLGTAEIRAAAQLADDAWHQYCGEAGGDAATTASWARERLARDRALPVSRPAMDCRTAEMAFRALFDRHGVELPLD